MAAADVVLAGAGQAGDPTAIFLQYGVVGAVAVVLTAFAWVAYRRERDRADRLEQQLQLVNDKITDRFAELVGVVRNTLAETNDILRELSHRRRT